MGLSVGIFAVSLLLLFSTCLPAPSRDIVVVEAPDGAWSDTEIAGQAKWVRIIGAGEFKGFLLRTICNGWDWVRLTGAVTLTRDGLSAKQGFFPYENIEMVRMDR